MGVSKKWVKALLGLRGSDKSQSSEKDDNGICRCFVQAVDADDRSNGKIIYYHVSIEYCKLGSTAKIWHRRKQSIEIDNSVLVDELDQTIAVDIAGANLQSISDSASSASNSLQVQNAAQLRQMREKNVQLFASKHSLEGSCGRQVQDSRQHLLVLNQIKTIGVGIGWKDGWLFGHGRIGF